MNPHSRHILCFFLTAVLSISAYGQDIEGRNKQKKQLEDEIELINKQLSSNRSRQKSDLSSLQLTQKKISTRKKLISEIDTRIDRYGRNIRKKTAQIAGLNARLDTLMLYYQSLIYNAYKNRDTKIWFMYLMASKDISQGVRRWTYLKNLSVTLSMQAEEIKKTRAALEKQKSDLSAIISKANDERQDREKEFNTLTQEEQHLNKSLSQLSRQEKSIKKQLAQKRSEVERLNREIEQLISKSLKGDGTSAATDSENAMTELFIKSRGSLAWPVDDGVIIEPFGQNEHPIFKNLKLPFNNGVNISTSEESEAFAVFEGTVKQILMIPGYNQCILVKHGRFFTFYCKLKKVTVKPGETIRKGAALGIIESAGNGTSVLHFELWDGTNKQNPELWLLKR